MRRFHRIGGTPSFRLVGLTANLDLTQKKKKSDQTDTPRPTPRTLSPRYDFGLVSLHPSFLATAALEYPSVAALCRSKHAAAAEEGEWRRKASGGRRQSVAGEQRGGGGRSRGGEE
jgi:hypothetical protein